MYDHTDIPPTVSSPATLAFWAAIVFTGLGAGIAAGLLTMLLDSIEHFVWPGPNILDAAAQSAGLVAPAGASPRSKKPVRPKASATSRPTRRQPIHANRKTPRRKPQ